MSLRHLRLAVAASALLFGIAPIAALAQTAPAKPAAKPAPKPKAPTRAPARKPAAPPPKIEYVPAEAATAEQIDAADRVYYGVYDCEFKQTIDITKNLRFPAFVDVKHGAAVYLMKPVLSSTGAIRLEDIRGETLMVQISSKSMLLNVKTANRIVDDCVSPRQRELIESARVAKVTAAASAAEAARAASTPAMSAPAASASMDAASASPAAAASASPTSAPVATAPVSAPAPAASSSAR